MNTAELRSRFNDWLGGQAPRSGSFPAMYSQVELAEMLDALDQSKALLLRAETALHDAGYMRGDSPLMDDLHATLHPEDPDGEE